MLERTFCHIHGLGATNEQELWKQGLETWRDVRQSHPLPLSSQRSRELRRGIQESSSQLRKGNGRYFADKLPSNEQWRIFPTFADSVAYLDIETTGTDRLIDKVTTICVYDGKQVHSYVKGHNLEAFKDDIRDYKLIVTYNGKRFDIPFLESAFDIRIPQAHIDLHHILGSLGIKGGLKICEKRLGIDRQELADITGEAAIVLWYHYARSGNENALDTLLAYNALDVVNLQTLMYKAYNMKLQETPFCEAELPVPDAPSLGELPFDVDTALLRKLSLQ